MNGPVPPERQAAAILLTPGLCLISVMKPLPEEKRMIRKTWFDFLW